MYSAVDGTVVKIGYEDDGRGNYIIVEADYDYNNVYDSNIKIYVLYAHLIESPTQTNSAVREQEHVTTETLIGKVGQTGAATGNHLHLSILIDGTLNYGTTSVTDPLAFYPNIVFDQLY